MAEFSHFNEQGRARMVDVSEKKETARTAIAAGEVLVNQETFDLIKSGGIAKGDGTDWRNHGSKAYSGSDSHVSSDHGLRD